MRGRRNLVGVLVLGSMLALAAGLGLAQGPAPQAELGTVFTYQGRLTDASGPVNDICNLTFRLYDQAGTGSPPTGGTLLGTDTQAGVEVRDGLFTVALDFGTSAFTGDARWLEISVDCGVGAVVLSPRQALTAAPYALYASSAGSAPWAGLKDVPAGFADGADNDTTYTAGAGLTLSDATLSMASTYRLPQTCTNGQIAEWDGAAWICGDDDVGTGGGGGDITAVYAGTGLTGGGESGAVTLHVGATYRLPQTCANGQIAEWNGAAWECANDDIGGGAFWSLSGNSGTAPGTHFIGTADNKALELKVNNARVLRLEPEDQSPNVIGGHSSNAASPGTRGATISGGGVTGWPNRVTYHYGSIGGGNGNEAGHRATVSGGDNNVASAKWSSIGGGSKNTASGEASVVGGGQSNSADANYATIAGGGPSDPLSPTTTNNRVTDDYGTIGGGAGNQVGDADPDTYARFATVSGGRNNTASGHLATIGGGLGNIASGASAVVGGGENHHAAGLHATIGGGSENEAGGDGATVSGGTSNSAVGQYATISGGSGNEALGRYATVAGGHNNQANGDYSFAAGRQAAAINDGCFVWSDSLGGGVLCDANDRWVARASGGVYFYTNANSTSGVKVSHGESAWSSVSDRTLKENFEELDYIALLERLAADLPITTWNYKSQDPAIRHIGPMAQDFYAAFGVGEDDRHISTVDADGVALAAIQGLYQLLQEKEQQLADQQAQITDLEARLAELEALVTGMAADNAGGGQ